MRRSIRWSLLLGHALLLGGVMAAFGGVLYLKVRESTLGAVDAELLDQAKTLAASMTSVSEDRFELALSKSQVQYFNSTGFYVVWGRRAVADYSDSRFADVYPYKKAPRPLPELRVVTFEGPHESRIVVGRSIHREQEQLGGLLKLILSIGTFVFAVGFIGGWFLIGRILNPIRRITGTAASISESNLSSRIDLAVTEDELGDLARTLNSAFDRLASAMNQLRRFTADASHELRTPICVLMTQLELALKKERTPEEYRQSLETCLKTVRRMADLAERLLFLSQADAGAIEWARHPMDLKDVVEETAQLVMPLADSRGIRLSTKVEPHPVEGDRMRLGEAVMNLLTNAIQHNRPDGSVEVTLKQGVLSVADTGTGISAEDRPRVFERFYRADQARSRNSGGAGLGLAITKAIVVGHGGTIDFESRVGGGTVFKIRLPGSRSESTAAAASVPGS